MSVAEMFETPQTNKSCKQDFRKEESVEEDEKKQEGYTAEMEEERREEEKRHPGRLLLDSSSVSLKRSCQLVRSDALSPTSVTRHMVESEPKWTKMEAEEAEEGEKRSRNGAKEVKEGRRKSYTTQSLDTSGMEMPRSLMMLKQESLESNLFKKKKLSQAEKHRGWIRMRNLSNVKISIQVKD